MFAQVLETAPSFFVLSNFLLHFQPVPSQRQEVKMRTFSRTSLGSFSSEITELRLVDTDLASE